jgi:RNA polymerase sigma-70 factor (ECF subfamily)
MVSCGGRLRSIVFASILGVGHVADGTQTSEDASRSQQRRARRAVWSGYHGGSGGHRAKDAASEQLTVRQYPADRIVIDKPNDDNPDNVRDGLDRLLPRLWRFCLVLSGDRSSADDLVQAACLRALEREQQFEIGTRLDHWVFRIAHSIWLNQLRAEKVRRGRGVVPVEDAGLVEFNAESNLYLAEVLSEIMALPEPQRVAVLLVYVEGYSYKEAAEQIDIPIGTVMSRLAGARSRLSALRDRLSRDEG